MFQDLQEGILNEFAGRAGGEIFYWRNGMRVSKLSYYVPVATPKPRGPRGHYKPRTKVCEHGFTSIKACKTCYNLKRKEYRHERAAKTQVPR
jgi:hypothetical protein